MKALLALGFAGGVTAPIIAGTGSAHAATMSDWDSVAQCEAGGDWSLNYSSDGMSVGGLQFQTASWNAALDYLASAGYDVSGFNRNLYQGMPRSQVPSKDQTILAGEALLYIQGPSAWTTVSDGCASLGTSMFDGGPNPWGLPGTQWPGSGGSAVSPPQSSGGSGSSGDSSATTGEGEDDGSGSGVAAAPGVEAEDGGSDGAQSSAPAAVPSSPAPAVAPSTAPAATEYTVVPGDCLWSIARAHGIADWHTLYNANLGAVGSNPDLIHPSLVLVLP